MGPVIQTPSRTQWATRNPPTPSPGLTIRPSITATGSLGSIQIALSRRASKPFHGSVAPTWTRAPTLWNGSRHDPLPECRHGIPDGRGRVPVVSGVSRGRTDCFQRGLTENRPSDQPSTAQAMGRITTTCNPRWMIDLMPRCSGSTNVPPRLPPAGQHPIRSSGSDSLRRAASPCLYARGLRPSERSSRGSSGPIRARV